LRIPRLWKVLSGFFAPPKGRSERKEFSLGKRSIHEEPRKEVAKERPDLSRKLDDNVETLKKIFHVPQASDVVFREFLCARPEVRVAVAYIEGMASYDKVFRSVLQPLMLLSSLKRPTEKNPKDYIKDALTPNGQVEEKKTFKQCWESMIAGDTIVLIDGQRIGLSVETKGWEHRTVEQTVSERLVRGPQQGFGEVLRINTALLRSYLRTPDLVFENFDIGNTSRNQVVMAYLANIANSKVVAEVRRRLKGIKIDALLTSGKLEQFIEAHHTLFPTILSSERPDRVAHFLLEGSVAIMVAGDPFALIAPVTVFSFIHSPEDYYTRWPFGNVLRIIRVTAFLLTVFLPGLYVAIVNYHPEMVPTVLLLAIASSREMVPFPLPFEVLLMYFGFELIREAGIRIPSPIGPTIGIVGALLIGQSAVTASLVSPIMVIVIAVTAVGAFSLPNQEAIMATRVLTLFFIIAGSVLGLLGIVAFSYALFCHAFSSTSLGVPIFAPLAPRRPDKGDYIYLRPAWKQELRPSFLRPKSRRRQPEISREWDEGTGGDGPGVLKEST